ncbi:MAG: type II toxin-antitoxin system HicB family antitoxin [Anaerolineales bacterium]|nr:type II toxin-antitoxin system HicB family antitoxin [Anaerolineales bacterium]
MERRYLIVIEKTEHGFSAYAPDIDGCVAVGETREEAIKNIQGKPSSFISMEYEKTAYLCLKAMRRIHSLS